MTGTNIRVQLWLNGLWVLSKCWDGAAVLLNYFEDDVCILVMLSWLTNTDWAIHKAYCRCYSLRINPTDLIYGVLGWSHPCFEAAAAMMLDNGLVEINHGCQTSCCWLALAEIFVNTKVSYHNSQPSFSWLFFKWSDVTAGFLKFDSVRKADIACDWWKYLYVSFN